MHVGICEGTLFVQMVQICPSVSVFVDSGDGYKLHSDIHCFTKITRDLRITYSFSVHKENDHHDIVI